MRLADGVGTAQWRGVKRGTAVEGGAAQGLLA